MPIVKQKKTTIYIPYYNLVFKNDMVELSGRGIIVEDVIFENGVIKFKPFYENQYYSGYMFNFSFIKRPFLNWIKYILVLITKRYIK